MIYFVAFERRWGTEATALGVSSSVRCLCLTDTLYWSIIKAGSAQGYRLFLVLVIHVGSK